MFIRISPSAIRGYSILCLSLLILSACGGGGSGGGDSASGDKPGTVGLLITDSPSDDFQEINLTVTKAELLSDSGSQTIFSGNKTFNLLDLENVTEIFAVNSAPAGAYSKIRLTLEKIELVHDDGSVAFPKLPGNGKLDLNPKGTFFVDSYSITLIQLDFDAEKSIHIVKTGKGDRYNFRPVVFVKIIRQSHDSKLVRITGTVNELETVDSNTGFELCDIQAQQQIVTDDDSEASYCVDVETTSNTSYFDENGDPSEFNDLNDGEIVTVFGRFAMDSDDDDGSGSNSNDSNSNSDDSSSSDGSSSSDDDSNDDGSRQLVLIAEVVMEDGLIETTRGISLSKVTTDSDTEVSSFEFVRSGASIPELPDTFKVLLQRGTRIYARDGTELTAEDIVADLPTQVDGVNDNALAEIKSAVIVITPDESDLSNQLTGTLDSVSDDFTSIIITTDPEAESRCVNVENARIYFTELDDSNTILFEERQASDLASGQLVDAFGEEEVDGCLNADTVIYQQQGAIIQPI